MKPINFKKYKFSTLYNKLSFKENRFYKNYRKIKSFIYKLFTFLNNFDFYRYKFSKIYKFIKIRVLNHLFFYKKINFKRFRYFFIYTFIFLIFSIFSYLLIPKFYNYDKSVIQNKICRDLNITCLINGEISYSFFPSPRINLNNFIIKDFSEKKKILARVENVALKLYLNNLLNKQEIIYREIDLEKLELYFNFKNLNNYKNFYKKRIQTKSINIKKSKIKFYDDDQYITSINNLAFSFRSRKNLTKSNLDGDFLGDKIHVELENSIVDKKNSQFILLKFFKSGFLAKANMLNPILEKNVTEGNILLKKNKNRLTSTFDYKDGKINVKNATLKNPFMDGKMSGIIEFLPYFDFNLNLELNRLNFNRIHNFLVSLEKENKKKLFRFNKKINGKLSFSSNKVLSKYDLVNSFESRVKFINGDLLVEQLLLNLGKMGAADIVGLVKNDEKYSNFKFEKNIFIDNDKYFFSKFGVFNRKNLSSFLFLSGNFDLINLKMHFNEISHHEKLKGEDIAYIENEFNDLLLGEGYASFFDYLRLKEFVKLIMDETS